MIIKDLLRTARVILRVTGGTAGTTYESTTI